MNQPRSHRGTEIDALNGLTARIIGCAIEVHKVLGPASSSRSMRPPCVSNSTDRSVRYERQVRMPAYYKGRPLGKYQIDLIVEDLVVVEMKSVSSLTPVFEAQVLTYLAADRKTPRPADQLQLPPVEGRCQRDSCSESTTSHDAAQRRAEGKIGETTDRTDRTWVCRFAVLLFGTRPASPVGRATDLSARLGVSWLCFALRALVLGTSCIVACSLV